MKQEDKSRIIKTAFTKAGVLIVVIYIAILIIDVWLHPAYKGWVVASFAVCSMLVGMATGFIMAFRIRFSTVMVRRTDKEMIKEIRNQPSKSSGNFGLDDRE